MYVCMYSIYISHYRWELNPDLMTLFRFQFGRCVETHHVIPQWTWGGLRGGLRGGQERYESPVNQEL